MLTKEECNGLGILTNNPEVWYAIEKALEGFRRMVQEHLSRDIELYQIYRDQGKLDEALDHF